MPFDFFFATRKAISTVKPELFISVETEIWPNLFSALKRRNVPIMVLNGRISRKSFIRYSAFIFIIRNIMNMVDCYVMRSDSDASLILKLGVPEEKVIISKSVKFDQAYQLSMNSNSEKAGQQKIIVFGSVHRAEEQKIVEICKKLLGKYEDILVVIAPRALDRTNIYYMLKAEGIQYESLSSANGKARVLIVDRYGVLTEFYNKCDVAFVGGSLVPAGGQNPIEPLAFKKPVIYGKFHWDFEQEWEKVLEAGCRN